MTQPAGLKALIAHRNVLVALTRYLMQDRTGGAIGAALQMLVQVLHAKGALAYRVEGHELVLVTEIGLPRKAKAWLAHLPLEGEPWFVAQRVAQDRKGEVDTNLAAARAGLSIRPALESADWLALCGVPMLVGREVFGALVIAADSETRFDKQTVVLLETVGGILALALERERLVHQAREQRHQEQEAATLGTLGLLAGSVVQDLAAPLSALHLQLEDQLALLEDPNGTADAIGLNVNMGDGVRHMARMLEALSTLTEASEPEGVDLAAMSASVTELVRGNLASRGIRLEVDGTDTPRFVYGRTQALRMLLLQLVLFSAQESEAAARSSPVISVKLESVGGVHALKVESSGHTGQRSGNKIFDTMLRGTKGHAAVGLELAKQTVAQHDGNIEIGASPSGGHLIRVVLPAGREERPPTPIPPSQPGEYYEQGEQPYADQGYSQQEYQEPYQEPYQEQPYQEPYQEPYEEQAPAADKYRTDPSASYEQQYQEEPGQVLDAHALPSPSGRRRPISRPSLVWIDDDTAGADRIIDAITSHEVYVAPSLQNARDLLPALQPPPEIVLCAVVMPDGYGTALHGELDHQLASRFVFITGGVIDADVAAYLKSSGCPTLIKPISADEVLYLVGRGGASPQARVAEAQLADRRKKMQKKMQTTLVGHSQKPPADESVTGLDLDLERSMGDESLDDAGRVSLTADIESNEITGGDLVGSLISDMDDSDIDW